MMKSVNKSLVLNTIRIEQPISRAEIADATKLTRPTVSTIVKELIDEGMVIESELGASKGGRKPTMLLINKSAAYIIGIDAGPRSVTCVLSNLSGEIKHKVTKTYQAQPLSNESFIQFLIHCIEEVLQTDEHEEKTIGIGVAMHGVVDVKTGTSVIAPILHLRNISLKEKLEKRFNISVQVENDARAIALGEAWFGKYESLESMVAVNLGTGVGAGMVLNGQLYHGPDSLAGEIGHMVIDIHGEKCECGSYGCLQTFVSAPSIVRRANNIMPEKKITSSKKVYELALKHDKACVALLKDTGNIIGIGLLNLIHTMNPDIIILSGGVSKAEQFIIPAITHVIQERGLTKAARNTKVVTSQFGDDATLLGAIAIILTEVFH